MCFVSQTIQMMDLTTTQMSHTGSVLMLLFIINHAFHEGVCWSCVSSLLKPQNKMNEGRSRTTSGWVSEDRGPIIRGTGMYPLNNTGARGWAAERKQLLSKKKKKKPCCCTSTGRHRGVVVSTAASPDAFLCGVSMFPLCLRGLSPGTPASFHRPNMHVGFGCQAWVPILCFFYFCLINWIEFIYLIYDGFTNVHVSTVIIVIWLLVFYLL